MLDQMINARYIQIGTARALEFVVNMMASTQAVRSSAAIKRATVNGRRLQPRYFQSKQLSSFTNKRHTPITSTTNNTVSSSTISPGSTNAIDPSIDPNHLVEELLTSIDDGNDGLSLSEESRSKADGIINQLELLGQGSRPLENDLIFGNYNVAYVSQGNRQLGQPAGGRFRTGFGKLLFKTTKLCQSVLRPDVVTNKVELLLFGVVPCAVGLRGSLVSIPEDKEGTDNADTVKVFFQPPVLSLFGDILHTRIGPSSSVVLKTTYVDEKIRLGRGSRGSLFVFTRGGPSDDAKMDQVGLQKTSNLGLALIASCVVALVGGGAFLAKSVAAPAHVKGAGLFCMLLGTALAGVFYRGGIMEGENYDRSEVMQP